IHPDYIDNVLSFALYVDLELTNGVFDYSWVKSFDTTCASLTLPGYNTDGEKVEHVHVHVMSEGAINDYTVHSMSLIPIRGDCSGVTLEKAVSYGDPHLQTLSGYTYDYFTVGDHLLFEATTETTSKTDTLTAHMRTIAVATSEEVDTDPTIANAVALAWDTPQRQTYEALGLTGWAYSSTLVLDCQTDTPSLTYNGKTVTLPGDDETLETQLSTSVTLSMGAYAHTSGSASTILSLSFRPLTGLAITLTVTQSAYDVLYIDTGAETSQSFMDSVTECSGCLGTCGTLAEDTTYVTDTVMEDGVVLASSALLPEVSTYTLPTVTTMTVDEATALCTATGIESDLVSACVSDTIAMGSLPADLTRLTYMANSKASLVIDPTDPETPTTSDPPYALIGGAVGVVVVGVLVGFYLKGKKAAPKQARDLNALSTASTKPKRRKATKKGSSKGKKGSKKKSSKGNRV
ncbi:hypothetical protein KIPB_009532, partial [Kipferlia bialata]